MSKSDEAGWERVQDAAARMFRVWVGGGELAWAEEAWGHLYNAGLANEDPILEDTAAKLRLVTLARIYQEFSGLAWDENPETPLEYLAEDLDIDDVALGILAASAGGEYKDASDDNELRELALTAVTNQQRREIFECLKAAYGSEVHLYARLFNTHKQVPGEDGDGEELEPTFRNCAAYEYVRGGFRHG